MNTKIIPAVIMLLAGSVTCIVTYINHYSLKEMLITLFVVFVIFLIIGIIVKKILDSLHLPGENAVSADGEVIEKSDEDLENQLVEEMLDEGNA